MHDHSSSAAVAAHVHYIVQPENWRNPCSVAAFAANAVCIRHDGPAILIFTANGYRNGAHTLA